MAWYDVTKETQQMCATVVVMELTYFRARRVYIDHPRAGHVSRVAAEIIYRSLVSQSSAHTHGTKRLELTDHETPYPS
jgi:hypothetical protein